LGGGKVTLSGPSGVEGNVAIGPNGFFEQSGSTKVTGDVLLDSGAIHHTSGGVVDSDLTAQINDAIAASSSAAALCSTYGPALTKTQTITGNGGQNVL